MLANGEYKTKAGSFLEVYGKNGGKARLSFDWLGEVGACFDCKPYPYPECFGEGDCRIVWECEECGCGDSKLF